MQPESTPPAGPEVVPPPIQAPPRPAPANPPSALPRFFSVVLSICLGLFLLDGLVSLLDDSLRLVLGLGLLTVIRGILFLFTLTMNFALFVLMALSPMVPKRLFLPIAWFAPVATLVMIPFMIYSYDHLPVVGWGVSLGEFLLGLIMLWGAQGSLRARWPLVPEARLGPRAFSWGNLLGFVLGHVVVLIPLAVIYVVLCTALAVDHFSDGFLKLRRGGLAAEVKKFVGPGGKTVELVPMTHIGEPEFYRDLSESFPTNALILMEGVSDDRNLITNKITYHRMATKLGVAEQQKEFKPRGEVIRADVDVEVFTTNTIALLNIAMMIHARGLQPDVILQLLQFSTPNLEQEMLNDLLHKRNRRVLEEIQTRLPDSDLLIVPWGAAHMPEIAREIQSRGFQLKETSEYIAIRFGARPAGRPAPRR